MLLVPAMLIIALIVRRTSIGPAFYRQVRVGLNGQQYHLYKFRTMYIDAEKEGPRWTSVDDPRITRTGHFLRRTRLDELPQIYNVLLGQMSFIGPRPERPEFVAKLEQEIPYYDLRHLVKPGITGWAQVMYNYGASTEDAREKLQYDLFYIKNQSILLDSIILLKTLKTIMNAKGR
jgi:lipopolysaccharide/colanic/teichoic acid biosynthesis glycosyltransferase